MLLNVANLRKQCKTSKTTLRSFKQLVAVPKIKLTIQSESPISRYGTECTHVNSPTSRHPSHALIGRWKLQVTWNPLRQRCRSINPVKILWSCEVPPDGSERDGLLMHSTVLSDSVCVWFFKERAVLMCRVFQSLYKFTLA